MLEKLLEINKNDVITVVGAGGKTSLITYLSKQLSSEYSILLTTTTKIYIPKSSDYNNIILTDKSNTFIFDKGITLCGKCINEENKVVGLDFKELDILINKFDVSLIEGDGSKRKKLKGWRCDEPLVHPKTTKNIGVLDITSYDMYINNRNIHRLDKFSQICGRCGNKITLDNLKNIVLNKDGLFKNSIGDKILFINKVDNEIKENLAKELISMIKKEDENIKIIYGSLIRNYYKEG
ncbi:selenium cofactor biosynthesis protein YqeC [Paraclostridium ghonii]|uniref:selenium cofactor biosynthesis protein YqeC n=1 Tax=Paraclostridium ghonii TaxID=29358 RepID=UPI00202CE885|nr:selenium cofactor biosynthesis protein YqeC [Paeniclostridium ghonii]MCM0167509.1 putative selenium-dependent hydroxylase accessory protein YqeC [Paeniclostridium ghonii]